MSLLAFILVLAAAALHAAWNSMVKLSGDQLVVIALIMGASGLIAVPGIFIFPVPAPESWPFLALTLVIHGGYIFFLLRTYAHGDLAQVFPIARGTATVLLAGAAFVLLGERLDLGQIAAVALISLGILSLALRGHGAAPRNPRAVAFALVTAGFIAGYTLVDGHGARLAGPSPHGFIAWLFVLHGIVVVGATWMLRGRALAELVATHWRPGVAGGAMGITAYWIVVWALSTGTMAPVAALRETSVIFAALFAAVFLKERMTRLRIAAAVLVAGGAALLHV